MIYVCISCMIHSNFPPLHVFTTVMFDLGFDVWHVKVGGSCFVFTFDSYFYLTAWLCISKGGEILIIE